MSEGERTTISLNKGLFAEFKARRDAGGYTTEGFIKRLLNFTDTKQARLLPWLVTYVIDEQFAEKHMAALVHIVALMNNSRESEKEILDFAESLHKRYSGE